MQQIDELLHCRAENFSHHTSLFAGSIEIMQKYPPWEQKAIFCLSAAWPYFVSPCRALLQETLHKWEPNLSTQSNWDIRNTMINEALWDKPSHVRNDWAIPSSASIANFFIGINRLDNAAYMLNYEFERKVVKLLSTPLTAKLIRCLDAVNPDQAIKFGENALQEYSKENRLLNCEPLVRVALADVYMAVGNYTCAVEHLKPVLRASKASTHLKILVSLRLNKAKRRIEPQLDLAAIGLKSPLKFAILHLETVPHPLKIVCISELVATLNQLCIPRESEPVSWAIPHLAWRKLSIDQSMKSDWRYETLQSLLKIQEHATTVIEKPLESQSSDFLEEFYNWIENSKINGFKGTSITETTDFIPESKVVEFWGDGKHYESFLKFIDSRDTDILVLEDMVMRTCSKIVCILLLLKQYKRLQFLPSLLTLHDSQLPYLERPKWISSNNMDIWKEFYQTQWMFCVKPLRFDGREVVMPPEYILPIRYTRYLGAGACAVVDKAMIHERYVEDEFGAKANYPTVCAWKVFVSSHAKQYYKAELQAFKHLANGVARPESIIGFFGSLQIGDTFALLLEYADMGDLETYMRQVSPPTSDAEMDKLWKQVLQLGNALAYQHKIPYRGEDKEVFGWHQDIKPSNILVTNGPNGVVFKLADFGLSHFRTLDLNVEDILDWDSFGTRIYGAPESFIGETSVNEVEAKVGQGVDVWSLGCVYSEIAVWSAFGFPRLERYRQTRERETRNIPGLIYVGCFHNGRDVLSAVNSHHSIIGMQSKYSAPKRVISLIYSMLLEKETRLTSQEVVVISAAIFHEVGNQQRD
ncbi:kinase-like domain-containing protein [Annulohypoxylon moriforme]|nr:kinase-like domain-containing protein [Annulohypoxylon moriforme]